MRLSIEDDDYVKVSFRVYFLTSFRGGEGEFSLFFRILQIFPLRILPLFVVNLWVAGYSYIRRVYVICAHPFTVPGGSFSNRVTTPFHICDGLPMCHGVVEFVMIWKRFKF